MKILYAFAGAVTLALAPAAGADPLADDFWLLGDYTQNKPCKGDGTDPAELKVKISTEQIESHQYSC
jgi:hypothetical protein